MEKEVSDLIDKQTHLIESMQKYIDQLEKTQVIGKKAIDANSKAIDSLTDVITKLERFAYEFSIRQFERQIVLMKRINSNISFDSFRSQAEHLKEKYQKEQIISIEYIYKLEVLLQEHAEKLI